MHLVFLDKIGLFLMISTAFHLFWNAKAECTPIGIHSLSDDYHILYFDGVQAFARPLIHGILNMPCTTRVIAIFGMNVKGLAGIKLADSSGYIVTNNSWKCTNSAGVGWANVDYDDSHWPDAVVVNENGLDNTGHCYLGADHTTQWIWSSNFRHSNTCSTNSIMFVYCRKRLDTDECSKGRPQNLCDPRFGQCVNLPGSYKCVCNTGYYNSAPQSCDDIDECKLDPPKNLCDSRTGECVNLPGSYKCICKNGYSNNSTLQSCQDIDECTLNPPENICEPRTGQCVNLPGSYICNCLKGYYNSTLPLCEAYKFSIAAAVPMLLGVSILVTILPVILYIFVLRKSRTRNETTGHYLCQTVEDKTVSAHPESNDHSTQTMGFTNYVALQYEKENDQIHYKETHLKVETQ